MRQARVATPGRSTMSATTADNVWSRKTAQTTNAPFLNLKDRTTVLTLIEKDRGMRNDDAHHISKRP